MDTATGAGLLVVPSLSCRPQCSRLPKSFPVGTSGLWRRRWTTHRSHLRTCYTSYPDGGEELVDVIGIGSRKYSIIDFCLASPSASASRFRFWTICSGDQKKIQLLERGHCNGSTTQAHDFLELIRNVEFPLPRYSFQPTVILFASTGHEMDHIAAINLLNSIKTAGGLAIAIVLKPFGFEGQRKQKEIDDLVNNLKSCLNFYVVVEADSCFKGKVGSFAEALESANNKAVLAMNTILSMISKKHSKILDTSEGKVKDVKPSEFVKVLERYGEVKIYYGADYNINAAIMQAILNCPFFHTGLKDVSGLAVMNLTCSGNFDDVGLHQTIQMFRHITGYTEDIIFSNVLEPNCDLKLGTLLLIMGYNEKMDSRSKGFFSSLLQSLPSIGHLFQLYFTDIDNNLSSSSVGNRNLSLDSSNTSDLDLSTTADSFEVIQDVNEFSVMLENVLLEEESYHEIRGDEIEQEEINYLSNKKCSKQERGELASVVSMDSNNHTGPAFHVAQLWAKKCFQSREIINDKGDIFRSPVGVKSSIFFPECSSHSACLLAKTSEYSNQEVSDGIAVDMSKKNSLLSVRTAMMLEAEREPSKNLNHIVEIQYRGGIYRGICHGGLPDGKGRLTSTDGSFYEGFWKCGKRSGLGSFCYSNGDLFRGPWRDDLMHGKGWFYFHTGDRWFANFWRGKANGEGRFFSKDGSAFFGNFRDGWRHGQCVSIDADGSRWKELWEDGVLQDRAPLDS